MQSLATLFSFFALCASVLNAYPFQPAFAKLKPNVDCTKNPAPLSYHIHVTYALTNEKQIAAAIELRDRAIEHFKPIFGCPTACQGTSVEPSGRYDNGQLCAIFDHDLTNDTLGPFPIGEWSFFVPVHYMSAVQPWFVQNRGEFSLLVHPNTGCENEDHTIWAQWAGPAWNLDTSIFTPNVQTNEFGETPGTIKNPTCAMGSWACSLGNAEAPYYGPMIPCCPGLECSCKDFDMTNQCTCV